ncbi:MAG: hypothetical protein AVDCRST_MAG40-851, partial [uncultured Gemmatimonadaceae bacterium]
VDGGGQENWRREPRRAGRGGSRAAGQVVGRNVRL